MRYRKLRRQKPGEVIEASTLADIADTAEWSSRLRADSPLEIISTAAGPILRLAGMLFSVFIAKTTNTITARSGNTPGSGPVNLYTFDGTSLIDTGIARTILNFSGSTVASGKFVVILKIVSRHFIISVEC